MMVYLGRLVFMLVFASAGVFLSWATKKAMARRRAWLVDGVVVEGEVVGFKEYPRARRSSGRIPVAPVVTFREAGGGGETRRFTSAEASWPNPFVVGQPVRVRYRPGDPRSVELEDVVRSWRLILAVGTLALACLLASVVPLAVTVSEWLR
jgi:hypothetical protein